MRIPRSSKLRLILAMGLMALSAALAPAGPAQAQASAGICDRSEQAQREILSHIPGVDDCAKVSDSHLSGITMMTIANSREPFALRAGDFDGLANLDWLVMLYADSPRTLPDGLFDGLTNLDNLDLTFFAGPDTLPDGIFDELENLTILHLRIDEDLDSLPGDVFDALTKLKRLSVKFEAGPTELPEGVFDELTNLEWLIVRNKTPADLPEGAFDELAKLEKLEWTYGLTSLPGGAFDALTNLEELDLSRNYLTSLPDGVFDALTNLEELDLSRNYLTSLPDGVFDALTNLEELDLSHNAISSMPDELFDDLPESTDLTVDRQNRKSPPDYPTRGRPVINGVAQVGQTLTVSTSGMSDQNGMTEATFEYRWYTHPNRRELQGTSGYDEGNTYTVGPDDAGKRILVKVKYTDDAGNRESIKSARTAPVSPPPVEVIPPTSPQFLESSYLSPDRDEVEVVWSSPIYNGGSPITRYRIEWIEADGSWDAAAFAQGGVSEPLMDFGWQFEIVDLQPCMSYRMRVIASNIAGDGKASAETMPEAPYPLESTMPNLDEAVVSYAALTLTYDEVLNQNLMPPASAFTVTVEGTRSTVDTVAVEGQSVTLTLADVVTSTDVVTVGYTNPAGTADGCIVGAAAGLAPSFSNWPATNNTGATDRPHGLRAAADSDVVTLTWLAPDADTDPSDYRILRHRPEAGETEPVVYVSSTGNTATSFTDTAAEPETLYVYRVQASDLNAQWGEVSEPVSIRVPRSNSPATGAPVITGMAQVGQTLTMYIHDIADADGMENTRFRIKWLADGMVIQGVYDHVLLLVAADEGKRIEVRVSFTDDAGNEENLTSTATDAVAARPNTSATGLPTISGMAQVDETMKADITGIADADGLTNAVFAHQWLADDADIQGATNSTYTLDDDDEGKAIQVRVSFTDDAGNEESLTSAPTPAVAAPPPPPDNVRAVTQESGAVELTWEAPQDATVTGYRIERSRADENRGGQQRSDGRPRDNHTLVEDTGSADTGYTDNSAEKGVEYEYRVSARNEAGTGEASEWVRAGPESASNSPATGAPVISGAAQVGETLTANITGIADADGLTNVSYNYQWLADDADIAGATGSTYTPTDGDQGKSVKVRVTFTDGAGNPETRTSAQTATVEARANSAGICDRTEQVRDNIISLLNAQDLGSLGIKDCSEVTEEYLTRIRFLDLAGGGTGEKITSLKSGDFEGLSGMSELNLEDNSLSNLPEGVFDGLSSLELLTMQGNDLSSLPDGVFDDLTKLHTLALYDNDLAALPDGVFDGLTKLTKLAISGNKLTALSGDVFTGLGGLTSLVASNNKLTSLPDGVFSGMSKLQSVSFSGNPSAPFTLTAELERQGEDGVVVKVSEGAPFAMTVTLSAEGGTLSATTVVIGGGDTESAAVTVTPEGAGAVTVSVDSAAFPDAGTVQDGIQTGVGESLTLEAAASGICDRTAQVRDAILEMLPDTSDCALVTGTDLRSITRLWLKEKEITTLKSGDFSGLSNLQLLHLARNELSALPDGIFDNLTSLQSLYLYNNHNWLSELPDGIFDDLTGLEVLHLFGIGIRGLPDDIFDNLSGLRSLRLGANWISELPDGVFDNLTGLNSLSIGSNDLSELPDGVFDNLTRLYSLSLGGNDLGELPDGIFDNLTGLGALTLTNIDLSELPDGIFDKLTRLDTLVLSDNDLSELPDGIFDELTGLWTLKLDGNDLSELPDGVFDKLTRLRWLTLGDNDFSELPDGVFDSLTRLDTLHLHRNELSELPDGVFDKLTELEDLYLLSNKLSRLPDGIFYGLASLDVLNIDDNTGSPFTLTAELERTGENTIALKIAQATPFDMEVTLSAEGGSLSSATVTIPAGNVSSTAVAVSPDGAEPVTIRIVSAAFLLGESQKAKGIQTGLGGHLTLGEDSDTNTPSTGAPTISGTAQVGKTLTANTSGIADADGLTGATFSYQWVSSDGTTDTDITDIERATGSTFTLVAVDKGKAIKVRVTFTDDGGNEETLTSAPTGPVFSDGLPGAPRYLTATAGDREVTLSWDPPADNGNAPATRYRIEWRVDGKDYDKNDWGTARSTTYTTNDQANLANGVKYFFRVKAENDSGYSHGPYGPASEEVSATPTSGSAVDLGTPVLSDTENLHHGMVRLDWQDIEDAGWYVVQYYHVEGGEWLDLPAEGVDIAFHGSSAVLSNLHGLSWLRVRAMSCGGESEWSQIEQLFGTNESDWEDVPVPEVGEGDEIEPCPVVLGTPVLSEPEDLHHGMVRLDWQDIEDAGWYVVQYYHVKGGEWLDLPAVGVDIAFHGSSAVLSNLHGLSWLRVRAMSCAGESEWSQIEQLFGTNASDWEGVPVPEVEEGDEVEPCSEDADTPDNSPATGAPTISGTVQVGETLTANTSGIADADGLSNVQYEYQWLADDTDIAGATGLTYTLTDSEESKAITVQVSFTDDEGNNETLASGATDEVAARPNSPATGAPTIDGTVQVGETLTASTSGVIDADGLSNVQYEYQWLADDTDIAGATGLTYTLTDSEESKAITVRVSFTDDADNEETLTSAATAAVASAQPTEPPDKPTGLEATTATHDSVTLTWDDPGDDTITGYVILRRIPGVDPEGHFDELVADTDTDATTYTDNTVAAEARYTYRIKAINGAGTSERSRWYHIDTPAAPVPDKPTGLEATASHDSVTLTWDDPGDDSITGYVILRRVRENDTGGDFSVLVADTGTAPPPPTPTTRWRPAPRTPTASRPSTSTEQASGPAGPTSTSRRPRSR